MKILLVEDDAALAAEVAKVLRAENFVLDHAATGEDAQHLGETEGYDAVVLDLGLPKGDGVSESSWIRRTLRICSSRSSAPSLRCDVPSGGRPEL